MKKELKVMQKHEQNSQKWRL